MNNRTDKHTVGFIKKKRSYDLYLKNENSFSDHKKIMNNFMSKNLEI